MTKFRSHEECNTARAQSSRAYDVTLQIMPTMVILNTVKDELGCFIRFLVVQTKRLSKQFTQFLLFTRRKHTRTSDVKVTFHHTSDGKKAEKGSEIAQRGTVS